MTLEEEHEAYGRCPVCCVELTTRKKYLLDCDKCYDVSVDPSQWIGYPIGFREWGMGE